jgi:hypothetical protein
LAALFFWVHPLSPGDDNHWQTLTAGFSGMKTKGVQSEIRWHKGRVSMDDRYENTPGKSLLVLLLLRYPGISSISIQGQEKILSFLYTLDGYISEEEQQSFSQRVMEHMETCRVFDVSCPAPGSLSFIPLPDITLLIYEQRLTNVHVAEIQLLHSLVHQYFGQRVISDRTRGEGVAVREERIRDLLQSLEHVVQKTCLTAYRDNGRVYIYTR